MEVVIKKFCILKNCDILCNVSFFESELDLLEKDYRLKNKKLFKTDEGAIIAKSLIIEYETFTKHENFGSKIPGFLYFNNAKIYSNNIGRIHNGKLDTSAVPSIIGTQYKQIILVASDTSKLEFTEDEFENVEDAILLNEII